MSAFHKLRELASRVDAIAEIPNSLRRGGAARHAGADFPDLGRAR